MLRNVLRRQSKLSKNYCVFLSRSRKLETSQQLETDCDSKTFAEQFFSVKYMYDIFEGWINRWIKN